MMELPFAEYIDLAVSWVSSTKLIQEWPECRQVYLERLSADLPSIVALPFLSCLAVGGYTADAIPVAVAWSMLRYAADFLDAVHDRDEFPDGISDPGIAIGYANGLIFAAFGSISTIRNQNIVRRVTTLFSQTAFQASLGQYLCQQQKASNDITLESYWHSTILKSGSIFRAGLGGGAASIGNVPDHYITALGDFGNALGVIRQIIDDCRDVLDEPDASIYEVTLPLLMLALRREESIIELMASINSREALSVAFSEANVPEMITSILLEWHRRALESLANLEHNNEIIALEGILKDFVTTPWWNLAHE